MAKTDGPSIVYEERRGQSETSRAQIERLGRFIMDEVLGEPSQSEGAVDTAIRIIRQLRAAENERTVFGAITR